MKRGIISKIVIMFIACVIAVFTFRVSYAAESNLGVLNGLDGLQDIESSSNTTNTTTQNTTNTSSKSTTNKTNTTNSTPAKIPQTGSNALYIFAAGVVIVGIVAAVLFNKFNSIKLQ